MGSLLFVIVSIPCASWGVSDTVCPVLDVLGSEDQGEDAKMNRVLSVLKGFGGGRCGGAGIQRNTNCSIHRPPSLEREDRKQ